VKVAAALLLHGILVVAGGSRTLKAAAAWRTERCCVLMVHGGRALKAVATAWRAAAESSAAVRDHTKGHRELEGARGRRSHKIMLDLYMWVYFFMFTKPNFLNYWRYKKNSVTKRFSKLPNDNFFQVNFSKQLEML